MQFSRYWNSNIHFLSETSNSSNENSMSTNSMYTLHWYKIKSTQRIILNITQLLRCHKMFYYCDAFPSKAHNQKCVHTVREYYWAHVFLSCACKPGS